MNNGSKPMLTADANAGVGDGWRPDFKAELSALEIFKDVPGALMDRITPEMQQFFADGTPLFHQGDPADSLFLILHGQVSITAGGMHLVARGPYAVIGEQAFINETSRTATARAQGTTAALRLPIAKHARMCLKHRGIKLFRFSRFPGRGGLLLRVRAASASHYISADSSIRVHKVRID